MSEFWSLWIIVLTAVTLVLVTWLLFVTRRMKQLNDDNTTGHNFDGIIEEDNPLPQWWLILFVITIVFGIGYLVVFPGLGNYQGLIAWSSASEHEESVNKVAERFSQSMDEFSLFSFDQLVGNEKAVRAGRTKVLIWCGIIFVIITYLWLIGLFN